MGRVHAPPGVDEDVEDGKDDHEECRRPLGLEADGDHTACSKANKRYDSATDAPLPPDDEAEEEEDEEDTSCEQEARCGELSAPRAERDGEMRTHYFLRSFSLRVGRPAKIFLRVYIESVKTMSRPPITLRLRRKKLRSKMSP